MTVETTIDHLSPQQKRALLERHLRERIHSSRLDLEAEARLEIALGSRAVNLDEPPRAIFLSGTTGFVGAFTLKELLEKTSARIYALVRAKTADEGRERILANLESYDLSMPDLNQRLIPIVGDLTKPEFGLTKDEFSSLAGQVEVVYHIGASVNLAAPYRELKPTNVDGTREIIRLAASERVKPLHYLSSYAIFDSVHSVDKTFSEVDEPTQSEGLSNGYAETKWVAEKMVRNCRLAGVPSCIYRVGWVVGHSETGAWNRSDFIPRLIKAFLETGKYCDLGNMTMTPVDYLAKSLVYLAQRKASIGSIFHLSNGKRYSSRQLFQWVQSCGYQLQEVALQDWEKSIHRSAQEISLAPLLLFLQDAAGNMSKVSEWFSREPRMNADRSLKELSASGVHCPDIDQRMMALYLAYFTSKGYIRRPH